MDELFAVELLEEGFEDGDLLGLHEFFVFDCNI